MIDLRLGDCLDVLRTMPDESVDAIVTDPPYGLAFMGKRWDYDVPSVEIWQECLRVLKPGGHLLAFAGTRTQHRMCVRIEDAGFEIRDMIAWVYGSGFPKSHDVSKAIDKAAGAEREVVATVKKTPSAGGANTNEGWVRPWAEGRNTMDITAPATDAARQWQGWGTALKPALEPITVARKPLVGTVADNVMRYGTGAINVDGCRVATDELKGKVYNNNNTGWKCTSAPSTVHGNETGRWPANLIHDGSDEVTELFPGDEGRFYYCAKASKRDRDEGLDLPEATPGEKTGRTDGSAGINPYAGSRAPTRNVHPTVKPTDLMRYLCRLVTQPGGVVLDPFMGSGSTGKAAVLEGFRFVGIEREERYLDIARARITHAVPEVSAGQLGLF
jgi:DNA modification methylase